MTTHSLRGIRLTLALVGAAVSTCQVSMAQQTEQDVKAAFIYNFTKYVAWPSSVFESGASPIVVGEVGADSLDGALESTLGSRTVDGRRFVVKHFHWGQDLSGCQVLFVPSSEMSSASQLSQLKDRPVLVIGESPGFAKRFGIINFVLDANHLRFEINAQAAREAGLTISSKLLTLGKPPGG